MPPPDELAPAADHYFSSRPRSPSRRHELRFLYRGNILTFEVDAGVFAAHGLDPGTALLIESLNPRPTDRILDLGCGWGAVGVAAAKLAPRGHVVMTDTNHRAIGLARANVAHNRITNVDIRAGSLFDPVGEERFDLIVTNPPYHIGRESILALLSAAKGHLSEDGRLILVGKGSQGIRFYQSWLEEHWGGPVVVRARGSGYRVLEAQCAPAPPREAAPLTGVPRRQGAALATPSREGAGSTGNRSA